MGRTEGGSEGREVFWASFQHRERSDTGGPGIPNNIRHSSGHSGKGGPPGSLLTPGGISWVWIVGR